MGNELYIWFYCLPIQAAIILVAVLTAAYLIVRCHFASAKLWKSAITLILTGGLVAIAVITLADRIPDTIPLAPKLIPLHSYRAVILGGSKEILRSNFMNVALFYPAGLLSCELLPGSWRRAGKVFLIAVLFTMLSAGIEFCQYRFALGQAEIDDVLHNALGAMVGAAVNTMHIRWERMHFMHRSV